MNRVVFVVNPASDGGRTARAWPGIAAAARERGLEVVERVTDAPGHATHLTREAVLAGEEVVVAVGGDGTVNEVSNGLCDEAGRPLPSPVRLGIIARGTGCDTIRTFRIPKRPRDAVSVIAAGHQRRIDLGLARYHTDHGPAQRVFINVASCGLTGDVARRANTTTKRFGGTAAFLYATAAAFVGWRNCRFAVTLDGVESTLIANNVVCANGRYFGGAIKIAPDAVPDDGRFDVVVIGDVGKLDLALNVHRLYRGTLERHPKVTIERARSVTVAPQRPLPVEIDGEQPGCTPISFDVIANAVSLLVP